MNKDFETSIDSPLGLGPLESAIMSIVWGAGRATVGEVTAAIKESRPIAYTTVMTVMSRLSEKGLLRRQLANKAYVYEPAKTPDEHRAQLARDGVRNLMRDFGDLALVNFLEELKTANPESLRRLTDFLEQADKR